MKLFVHIGMQKTGSTALQNFLSINPSELARHGLRFAESGRVRSWHKPMFDLFTSEMETGLKNEFANGEDLILSYEEFYLASEETVLRLTALADHISVLFFARDPIDWVNSYFNQLVKAHRVPYRRIREFAISDPDIRYRLDIRRHLQNWSSAVGRQNVHVLQYNCDIDIYELAMDWLGVGKNEQILFNFSTNNPNKSGDVSSLKIMLEVKRQLRDASADRLVAVMNDAHARTKNNWIDTRFKRAPMFLTSDDRRELQMLFRPSFDTVFAEFGGDAKEFVNNERAESEVDRYALHNLSEYEKEVVSDIINSN